MLTINGTDVHEDIAQLIRTNKMSMRLIGALIGVTLKSSLNALDACEHAPTAEQAFDIMANTSYEAAKQTLMEAAPKEGRFKNYINAFVEDFDQWLDHNAREATMAALNELRSTYTARYGFPVITAEAVNWIAQRTRHAELLEVGAGNAYLARQLQDAGVNVIPTDAYTLTDNAYSLGKTYHMSVIQIDAMDAITELNDLNLIWSWPTPDQASGEALQRFNGKYFIYIGEQSNGCTGGDLFNDVLDTKFEYCEGFRIPSFPGIHDSIALYQRVA